VSVKQKVRLAARFAVAGALRRSGTLRVSEALTRRFQLHSGRLRRPGPRVVIVCYHRIGVGGVPVYSELPARHFAAQMRYLKSHYQIIPLDRVPEFLASGGPTRPAIVVTFDDGYAGTYTEAFPVLRRYEIPATTYLTVGCIETGTLAWYDRIFLALQVYEKESLIIDFTPPRTYRLASRKQRLDAASDINRRLRQIPDAERVAICRELDRRIPLPAQATRDRMLNWQQVREMQAAGHSFGCHTMTHPAVSRLDQAKLEYELVQSRELLESRLGRPAADFAFPFGLPQDCGAVPAQLASFGYRSATTMVPGVNTAGADLFQLYRASCVELPLGLFAWQLNRLFFSDESAAEPQFSAARSTAAEAACGGRG
jgi:peptidoglycan/xylan/chitin deacetylase (PgdA/CDA1 family)